MVVKNTRRRFSVSNWTENNLSFHAVSIFSKTMIIKCNKSNSNGHTLFLRQVNNNPEVGDCSQTESKAVEA